MPRSEKHPDHCWFCREPYQSGITISITVATNGVGRRFQSHAVLARICQKCGNSPFGRRTRPLLQKALRGQLMAQLAVIESRREVQQGSKV